MSGLAQELYKEKRLMVRRINAEIAMEEEETKAQAVRQPLEYIEMNSSVVVYDPNRNSFTVPRDT